MIAMENHLYAIHADILTDTELFRQWYKKMPESRRQKIDNFKFDKDKRLSLGAGILLYNGLCRYGAETTEPEYTEHGKPYIKGYPGIYFNISHSGNIAVCAFSDKEVGVDTEKTKHFSEALIDHVFLPQEKNHIRPEFSDKDCTLMWTIKESIMKYLGTGIGLGARSIALDLNAPVSAVCDSHDITGLHFTTFEADEHMLTVCSPYPNFVHEIDWFK